MLRSGSIGSFPSASWLSTLDLLICDSKNIECYIHEEYGKYRPETTYISYGAETRKSCLADDDPALLDWYAEKDLEPKSYYLVVGRFVPENNYETMIREFMASDSKRDFALITNVSDKFLDELKVRTPFDRDPRGSSSWERYNRSYHEDPRERLCISAWARGWGD